MTAREELKALKAALRERKRQFKIDAQNRARRGKYINRYYC
jgi:hypothetical protein